MFKDNVKLKVRRQDEPGDKIYWDEFILNWDGDNTVADLLRMIAKDPFTADGESTSPVVWEDGCGSGHCGSCAMLINGKPLLACRAKVEDFPPAPIILEPLVKFPVVRDLWVDRSIIFESLKQLESWMKLDKYADTGPGAHITPDAADRAREFARCIHCGICIEACPSVSSISEYTGPAAIASSAAYLELNPSGHQSERMQYALMQPGGSAGCGKSLNCARLCPQGIPLTSAIAMVNQRINETAWNRLRGK